MHEAKRKQRTDSTHVLAAIRNRTDWKLSARPYEQRSIPLPLLSQPGYAWVPKDWFERYGRAVEEYQAPACIPARQAYAQTIGSDGMELLIAVWAETSLHISSNPS